MNAGQIRTRNTLNAIRLEWFTIGYMSFEAAAALLIGFSSRSASLETFGLDSVIEIVSGSVLLWRLRAEHQRNDPEFIRRVESHASRWAGLGLVVLAVYVALQSLYSLWSRAQAEPSLWGIALALLSLGVMPVLGRLKLKAAAQIQSRALRADAYETIACGYLSFTLLLGLAANSFLGWWWADPTAALVMLFFIVREAREALTGEGENEDASRD